MKALFVLSILLAGSVSLAAECHFKGYEKILAVATEAAKKGELSSADVQYIKDYGYGSAYNASGNNFSCTMVTKDKKERLVVVSRLLTRTNGPAPESVKEFILKNEAQFFTEETSGPN